MLPTSPAEVHLADAGCPVVGGQEHRMEEVVETLARGESEEEEGGEEPEEEEEEEEAEEEEEEEEEGEGSLRYQMKTHCIKETRLPFESTVLGTCWLAFVRRRPLKGGRQQKAGGRGISKDDAACRILYTRSESQAEKEKREKAGIELSKMRVWPNWVKSSRLCAGYLQDLEKQGKGPSLIIKESFPGATVKDLPGISVVLLDLASRDGLGKETVNNFKKWLSKSSQCSITPISKSSY
jgi:hypothetical protein